MIEKNEQITHAWSEHHAFLLDVAYRLLGNYSDAEDLVQEAFTRLLRADRDPIEDVRAWLVVVVSRLCLDQLRSARMRREAYVGPWFPEPLLGGEGPAADPANAVTLDESVHFAMLVVLERMSPAERVVFVLHDVFEFSFERVAAMVGRTPAACRQLASRARRRIEAEAGSTRFAVDPEQQRRIVDEFIAACANGDVQRLLSLLDPSVIGWADVGGTLPQVARPNVGRDQVAAGVMRFFGPDSGSRLMARDVNGERGVVVLREGQVAAVIAISHRAGAITRVYAVADPRKLAHVRDALIRATWSRPAS